MKTLKYDTVTLATRIPKDILPELQKIITKRGYVNISDYLRDLIRRDMKDYEEIQER